jgi:PAS domain S-box-containing protein
MAMTSIDPDDRGRFMQVNRAMCEITGYSEQELVGKTFRDITHPDDVQKSQELLDKLLSGQASSPRTDKRYLHADGHVVWGLVSLSLVRDGSGEPLYVISQVQDITERRHAEREKKNHQERLQALLDNAPAVVYAKDTEGHYLFINRRYETAFHVEAEETVGKTDYDLFPEEIADAFGTSDRRVLETGSPIELEEAAPQEDGLHTYLSIKFPLRDSAGVPYAVCGISTDVTERKQIEEELARNREAERGSQAKSEFLSRVSHELRTPLNAILGFAQLLELDDLDPAQRENVKHITRGGRHLLELINEILDISRIEGGNMTISLEPVHVQTVLSGVVDLVRPLAGARQVSITTDLDDAADLYVHADHQRLRQVLLNLLSNAVKYNREGGVATVSTDTSGEGRLRILITDTGPGIPEEQLAKLFSPFERLGAERSTVEGTGLGLALSKLLVEAMEGTVEVETEPGVGTTFVIELALAATPEIIELAAVAANGGLEADSSNGCQTVLHVEDNLSNLQLVKQALGTRKTINLISATDGELGLHLAREHHPDLVLLDLHLPGMTGKEVLEELKQDPGTNDIPVVMVSADATPRRIDELLECGARAYLTKPLDIRRFLEVVEESLTANGA